MRSRTPDHHGSLSTSPRRWLEVAVVLTPVVVLGVQAYAHRWMSEDAFITLRVVRNVLLGHGPVFNLGERVEAYTHPLWLAVLVGIGQLTPHLERAAVWLGLSLTLAGLALAMRGACLLNPSRRGMWVPLGALVVAVLPPFWDFATSGLETGLVFFWLGSSFVLLAGLEPRTWATPFLFSWLGLGILIRPDLGIQVLVFGLAAVARHRAQMSSRTSVVRCLALAAALPVFYQLFRMGYFASLLPNPALAKEAFSSDWARGLDYAKNFARPYALYIPAAAILLLTAARLLPSRDSRLMVLAPIVAGLLHAGYVVAIGGDFMHGRLLLPATFSLLMPTMVVRVDGLWRSATAVVIVVWATCCGLLWRPPSVELPAGIADERGFYVGFTGHRNPIDAADYASTPWFYGRSPMDAGRDGRPAALRTNVGIFGFSAPPEAFIVDALGLADPVASRLLILVRSRAGHEKRLPEAWYAARFLAAPPADPSTQAAREALACGRLGDLMAAVEQPLSARRFATNLWIAIRTFRLRVPPDPVQARTVFCGTRDTTASTVRLPAPGHGPGKPDTTASTVRLPAPGHGPGKPDTTASTVRLPAPGHGPRKPDTTASDHRLY